MHPFDLALFACALAAGLAVFTVVHRATDGSPALRLTLGGVAGLAATFMLLEIATLWLAQTADPWNNARLTPAVALHYGYKLYYPLHEGPVLSTVVGPVAFLAYWPIGFLRGSPTLLILAASALNLLVCAALLGALVRQLTLDAAVRWFTGLIGVALALTYPALRYSLFCIHADAPALFLSGLGAGLMIFTHNDPNWKRCSLAALCLALAVWSKQSLAPIFFAVGLVALLHHGGRVAVRFVVASTLVGGAVSGVLVTWLGFAELRDNMFVVPAHHPWRQMSLVDGEIFNSLRASGTSARIKILLASALHIVRGSWWLFAVLGTALGEHLLRARPGRRWPRRAWAAWLVIAIGLLPTAAIGRTKIGGEVNHESFMLFFLVAALVCWLAAIAQEHGRPLPARLAVVLAVLAVIDAPRALEYPGWRTAWDNQNEAAYRYDERHPGQIYFPWNPLTSLLAEGQLYHFDYGVFDRNLGGARVSAEHLGQHLPSARPLIASFIAHHDYILHEYFPEYVLRHPIAEIADWKIYGPPPPARDAK